MAERNLLHCNCIILFPLVSFTHSCWNLTRLLGTVSVGRCLNIRRTEENNPGLKREGLKINGLNICTNLHLLFINMASPIEKFYENKKYQDNKKDVCRIKNVLPFILQLQQLLLASLVLHFLYQTLSSVERSGYPTITCATSSTVTGI